MLVTGKFNQAKIFTTVVEESALEQIALLCDSPDFAGEIIRVMPDVHAGKGCTIGTTMTVHGKVPPSMVGVDIGCGMLACKLKEREIDFDLLDDVIRERVPAGMNTRETALLEAADFPLESLRFSGANLALARKSLGTLGGGNHFIEVEKSESGELWLVIHSGSRRLGREIAEYYQTLAVKARMGILPKQRAALIEQYKAEGREREISSALASLAKRKIENEHIVCAEGEIFDDYLHDMGIVQRFADENRHAIASQIVRGAGLTVTDEFTTVHNYIDPEKMILRKGAVSAKKGERLLISVNMRDGSLLCVGKGNPDWNESAPHGAGRLISRSKASDTLSLEEFRRQMEGIYSTTVCKETLDESPMAYKSLDDIQKNISPTAEISERLRPVFNFKAAEETPPWKRKK